MSPDETVLRDLSPQVAAALQGLVAAVRQWNPVVNLVSRASLGDIWARHIADSLQILDLAPPEARHWVDMGSGGGFPGLVIAAAALDSPSGLRVTLVEADVRKATFLRETARVLALDVNVLAQRVEDVEPLQADVVSARALGPLGLLWRYARPHLAAGGVGLFPKGREHQREIAMMGPEAARIRIVPSRTAPDAAIVVMQEHLS